MLFRPNPSLGVPIYLQLMEQVKHAIETGALRPGDQLPGIRQCSGSSRAPQPAVGCRATDLTGALRPGDQLPGIRPLAEELVMNPSTVAKAYRELEHEGVIELRHGAGAFVSEHAGTRRTAEAVRAAQPV